MASDEKKNTSETIIVPIEEGLKKNYLTYAMSVIIGRYIPDVRDGLKPVHRRILYSMYENNLYFSAKTRKSAKVVGEVLGNYHPHGDSAVYEALVRMAQEFSMRFPLIVGQGNFGSVDGDPPAAMRYTEVKLQKLSEYLLNDIDKDTVNFIPNYDNTDEEPVVLPASYPNLLVNGSIGIAVAMSTNVPPHNLSEILSATIALIDNPELSSIDLMDHVPAPDFPTGGIIFGVDGIKKAYETGKGSFYIRGKATVEEKQNKSVILVHEIPYGVKKSNLIIDIANHVKEEKIKGIAEIRDESNKDGMRIVIETKKHIDPQIILNQLYSKTQLQISFSINLLAIVDREPKILNLKKILQHFITHRLEVIIRRAQFNLNKAEARYHIVEGLARAIDNLNEVIKLIRASQNAPEARETLIERFELSKIQAQAILDLRLQKLTALEKLALEKEKKELEELILSLKAFLSSDEQQYNLIKEELTHLQNTIKSPRRTDIELTMSKDISMEDIIPNHEWLVMITSEGIFKRTTLDSYNTQNRGGRGKTSAQVRGEEEIKHMFVAKAHDYMLIFTTLGNVYYVKVYEIPESTVQSRGKSIYSFLSLKEGEHIASYLVTNEFTEDRFILFLTKRGMIKKTSLMQFINAKRRGITAINLQEGDHLLETKMLHDEKEIFITSALGKGLRMPVSAIRPTGRTSQGVIGIRLKNTEDHTIGFTLVDDQKSLIAITEKGFGKRVSYNMFTPHGRGTGGQIYYGMTKETGKVVAVSEVMSEDDGIFVVSKNGMTVRLRVKDIRVMGRTARGSRTVKLKSDDTVADLTVFEKAK